MPQTTPMLEQYKRIKRQSGDAILFFRLGDFYEMFGEDALAAHKILGITLTARGKNTEHETPMCGVPYHAAERYIARLTRAGKKVALCEQTTPPGKGIVERSIIRIVTPGTTIDTHILEDKTPHYIVAAVEHKGTYGFCIADISTGVFEVTEVADEARLRNVLSRIAPREIITPKETLLMIQPLAANTVAFVHPHTPAFGFDARAVLLNHFRVRTLHGFGIEQLPRAQHAAGLLLDYLKETQKAALSHVCAIRQYAHEEYMALDPSSMRNLELLSTLYDGSREGSLLHTIDCTKTAMGGRLLRQWLLHPLLSRERIQLRLDAVSWLMEYADREELQKILGEIADIERLLGKIGLERVNARDMLALKKSLVHVVELKVALGQRLAPFPPLVQTIRDELQEHQGIIVLLERAVADEPPFEITEGGIIKEGYNAELDSLREIARGGKEWIAQFAASEIQRTGIQSLKVKFNNVFGYYIEVSKANLKYVPPEYVRKQTMVNAERFTTPDLQEFEEKILRAEEKMKELEYRLFLELRAQVAAHIPTLQKTAQAVAAIDVLTAYAALAHTRRYVKPRINEEGVIAIKQGRHPVIETLLQGEQYIPNDVYIDQEREQVLLITGPNMSGKSSYLRQTALITLLAQIGSYVPAEEANICIVDRIFTRVGAADNVARGQSTFMVEMQETAVILHNATARSLIIIDELGRGTSTYDGLSIAWAVVRYIHDRLGAKTMFATHYHELIDMVGALARGKNYSIAVTEHEGRVVFLHHVEEGGTPDSYGIEVAQLAGIPPQVIAESKRVLEQLESGRGSASGKLPAPLFDTTAPENSAHTPALHPALQKLKTLNPNSLTPLQALNLLAELVEKIKENH